MTTELIFSGRGGMTYPEGRMKFIWDGRGITGVLSARCRMTADSVVLTPNQLYQRVFGWPELTLPREELASVEELFFGNYRFRSHDGLLDGACFRPIGSKKAFLTALSNAGIPVVSLSWTQRLRAELRIAWNQMRWGGQLRRRHLLKEGEGASELEK